MAQGIEIFKPKEVIGHADHFEILDLLFFKPYRKAPYGEINYCVGVSDKGDPAVPGNPDATPPIPDQPAREADPTSIAWLQEVKAVRITGEVHDRIKHAIPEKGETAGQAQDREAEAYLQEIGIFPSE